MATVLSASPSRGDATRARRPNANNRTTSAAAARGGAASRQGRQACSLAWRCHFEVVPPPSSSLRTWQQLGGPIL
eukprot:412684-Alexandrium_andersonii.AAC.1